MDAERVRHEGEEVALVVSGPAEDGIRFLTDPEHDHQLGVMRRGDGHVVEPHTHPSRPRTAAGRDETLMVVAGSLDAVLRVDGEVVMEQRLGGGDVVVVMDGELTVTAGEETEYVRVSSR